MNLQRLNLSIHRLGEFTRFVKVGLVTNLVYFSILALLRFAWNGSLWLDAALAYLASAVVNYVLHYRFTFKSSSRHDVAIAKYLVVQAGGMILNSAILHALVVGSGMHYVLGQGAAIFVVTGFTYFVNRCWVFSSPADGPSRLTGDS